MQFEGHVQHPPENRNISINGAKWLYVHLTSKIHSTDYQQFIICVNLFSEGILSDLQMALHSVWSQIPKKIFIFGMSSCCLETKGQKARSWKPSSCRARSENKNLNIPTIPHTTQNWIITL